MRNLIPYPHSCFDLFRSAVERKIDVVDRDAISANFNRMQPRFAEYDGLFATNQLEALVKDNFYDGIKDPLVKMYGYRKVAVKTIRSELVSLQERQIRYTCQYCTLEGVEQMDHIVSKTDFPEFSIHAKNLVPSCSNCNQKKSIHWRTNGIRNFLNPYLDTLPNDRYLFVSIFVNIYGDLDFRYDLQNRTQIGASLWSLIISHYTKLLLLERMRLAAITHLSEFQIRMQREITNGASRFSLAQIVEENNTEFRLRFGANHWKPALEDALVNSNDFWQSL